MDGPVALGLAVWKQLNAAVTDLNLARVIDIYPFFFVVSSEGKRVV
jgi:hypothetical protein